MSTDIQPLVSVIIPVYNAGSYLRPAVESILAQTYKNLEIIVVDDGSTDGCVESLATIRDPRIQVLRQANAGKSAAMNRALDRLTGAFYLLQDADDLSHPDRVARQLHCLTVNPDVAAVFCGHELLVGQTVMAPRFVEKNRAQCRADIAAFRMPAHDPTGMYRWSMVRQLRYEPKLAQAEGTDYILRVGEQFPLLVLGRCLYTYRQHPGSLTGNIEKRIQDVTEARRRALLRRGVCAGTLDQVAPRPRRWRHCDLDNGLPTHFMESVLDQRRAGLFRRALKTARQCVAFHPLDPVYYKPLVYSLLPLKMIQAYRSWKNTGQHMARRQSER